MDMERARAIVKQCCRNRMAITMGEPYVALPECSLAEMLEANEVVAQNRRQTNQDGTTTISMTVDPRGIAASYAFEQYGRDPRDLLESVGYRIRESDEGGL